MDEIKLKVFRFADATSEIDMVVNAKTTGVKETTKESEHLVVTLENTVNAADKVENKMGSLSKALKTQAENSISKLSSSLEKMIDLAGSKNVSSKFKLAANNMFDKVSINGMLDLDPSSMGAKEINKVLQATYNIDSKILAEEERIDRARESANKKAIANEQKLAREQEKDAIRIQKAIEQQIIARQKEEQQYINYINKISSASQKMAAIKIGYQSGVLSGSSITQLTTQMEAQRQAANEMRTTLTALQGNYNSIQQASNAETMQIRSESDAVKVLVGYEKEVVNGKTVLKTKYEEIGGTMKKIPPIVERVKTAFAQYAANTRTVFDATENVGNSFKKLFDRIKSAAVSWRIVYGTFSQIWNVLADTVDKAAEYEESLNLYTVALGQYAEKGSQWAEKISGALYLDPTNIMQYTGALYNLVEGYGIASDKAYLMSQNLTQLAYDMSSYLNIDVEAAFTKVQSAMAGQSRAVATAGVAMQAATLQELALSLGIEKSVKEMTQAEKVYLRYIQLIRSTTNMQGDLGRTIITPANALRVVKQQFVLLGRAIGQVFIPIVMKAIPYVMALTNVLTRLAASLGAKLGYKVADVDYSGLVELDNYLENTGNVADNAADKTSKASKKMQNSLAPFDELNVVENSSSGSGSGSSGSGSLPSIIDTLDDYLDGYDMLKDLTDGLTKQADEAEKNLQKLGKALKTIATIWAGWKILKGVDSLIKWSDAIKKAWTSGTGFASVLKTLVGRFTDGYRYAKYFGENGLTAVVSGFQNLLSPVGKVTVSLGLAIASFKLGNDAFKDWDGSAKNLAGNILEATLKIGALSGAALLLAGPGGAAVVAAAGLAGSIVEVRKKIQEFREEKANAESDKKLFDGEGTSVEVFMDILKKSNGNIETTYEKLGDLNEIIKTNATNADAAADTFEDYVNYLNSQDLEPTKNQIQELNGLYDNYKNSVDTLKKSEIDYYKATQQYLLDNGKISEEEFNKRVEEYSKLKSIQAGYTADYALKLAELDAKLMSGKITQEQYNEKVSDLKVLNGEIVLSSDQLKDSYDAVAQELLKDINWESGDKLKSTISELISGYEDTKKSIESTTDTAMQKWLEEQKVFDELTTDKEKKLAALSESGKKEYLDNIETQRKLVESAKQTYTEVATQSAADLTTVQGNFKGALAGIYGELVKSGKDTDKDYKETIDGITEYLHELEKVDASGAGGAYLQSFQTGMESEENSTKLAVQRAFEKIGIQTTFSVQDLMKDTANEFETNAQMNKDRIKSAYGTIGNYTAEGFEEGFNNKKKHASDALDKFNDDNILNTRNKWDIHSPSGVTTEFGEYIMEGFAVGLKNKMAEPQQVLEKFNKSMRDSLANNQLNLNISTNVESSFNQILNKLQKFSNNWTNGINNLMRNTSQAFNSISLGFGSKLTYAAMKSINIAKFAEGGFPTTGDLFFANENGVPEYITSIGNKSAVANQDQMVAALANAITNAIGSMKTNNQPGITQVYIGNKKVYEGQGKYQNRQSDRYGTNFVKV